MLGISNNVSYGLQLSLICEVYHSLHILIILLFLYSLAVMKATLSFAFLAVCGASAFNLGNTHSVTSCTKLLATSNDNNDGQQQNISSRRGVLSKFLVGATSLASVIATDPDEASADGSRRIAKISGSGLVFKDSLVVDRFDDPKVKGVTLYVSNFERPLTERVSKDFFTEPSYASVTAVRTGGPIEIADNVDKSEKGEAVFEEKRSLLFKELRVQRIYDEEKKVMVYVSFNTRLDKNSDTNKSRFKSSISAISLE